MDLIIYSLILIQKVCGRSHYFSGVPKRGSNNYIGPGWGGTRTSQSTGGVLCDGFIQWRICYAYVIITD
jgi:hypothetical protein